MPIKFTVENSDELRLIAYRYSGHIDPSDVLTAVTRAVRCFAACQAYRELLIFKRDTDLSDFDSEALATLYQRCDELYKNLKLGRRTAAAVLDDSNDAKLIVPLFNALSLIGPGVDLGFELFTDVEPALNWLGIPLEEGFKIVARTA